MALPQIDKLNREKLVHGLVRAGKGVKKKLGSSFEVADELPRLQDGQGIDQKSADYPPLWKDIRSESRQGLSAGSCPPRPRDSLKARP